MDNRNRSNARVAILGAVHHPLAYFSLCGLIFESFLLGISTFTDKVSILAPILIFVVLILVVFIMALVDKDALYGPKDSRAVVVKISFPKDNSPNSGAFDDQTCYLVIHRYERGKSDRQVIEMNESLGSEGIWYFYLPGNLELHDTVSLELTDYRGRRWKVSSFDPYETQRMAHLLN